MTTVKQKFQHAPIYLGAQLYVPEAAGRGLALQCSSYPRRAWAATGIVVGWFVCLFVCLSVTHESAHLAATALRLQHR